MLGHISFGVRDLAQTQAFYDATLAPFGWVQRWRTEHGIGYGPSDLGARGEIALFLRTEPGVQLAAGRVRSG